MKRISKLPAVIAIILGILCFAANAGAEGSKAEIKKRMESRYAALLKLKKAGKIGETVEGYVEILPAASSNKLAKDVAAAENADRKALYPLIAKGSKASVKDVAKANAARIFRKAGDTEQFKGKDGVWRQKKEMAKKKITAGDEKKASEKK